MWTSASGNGGSVNRRNVVGITSEEKKQVERSPRIGSSTFEKYAFCARHCPRDERSDRDEDERVRTRERE